MRTPLHRRNRPAATWLVALAAVAAGAGADDERPQTPIEVQEWSIWVGTPAQATINTAKLYRNAMPAAVGTIRPQFDEGDEGQPERFPIAPVSVVQFFGEPTRDVDVELRVKSGSLLAHWPPARQRGDRLQWFESDLIAEPPGGIPLAYLPDAHPFHDLRRFAPALFLKHEAAIERFVAYDVELTMPVPLKLRGGPDAYTLQNLTGHRLRDVALIAPTDAGFRVGWLDELPTAVPEEDREAAEAEKKAKEAAAKEATDQEKAEAIFEEAAEPEKDEEEAAEPLPPEGDATIKARMDQVLNRPVTLSVEKAPMRGVLDLIAAQARFRFALDDRTLAKEEIDPGKPTTLKGAGLAARDALAEVLGNAGLSYRVTDAGTLYITTAARLAEALESKGQVVEGPPVTLTLSQPLEAANPSYRELTRDAYARRLAGQGLRDDVVKSLLDRHGPALFEPGELIVVAHLAPEAIDDAVLLDVFPPPKKQVRVAILVLHGIDPRLQDHARTLVERLGDPSPTAREKAESDLFALGPVAVPALEDALTSKDVEVVFRAERLLLRLQRPVP